MTPQSDRLNETASPADMSTPATMIETPPVPSDVTVADLQYRDNGNDLSHLVEVGF